MLLRVDVESSGVYASVPSRIFSISYTSEVTWNMYAAVHSEL